MSSHSSVDRRRLVAAVAGSLVLFRDLRHASRAQTRPLVGWLRVGIWSPEFRAFFVQGMREHGLEEGRDYDITVRSTEGDPAREATLIAELIALKPAVIAAQTTGFVVALRKATDTIPIVGVTISDPIGLGLASSLAHPGGNVTGMLSNSASSAKVIEVLQQILPSAKRIGVLLNPSNAAHRMPTPPAVAAELEAMGVTRIDASARIPEEIEPAVQALLRQGVDALFIAQDGMFNQEIKRLADLALAARLPSAYGFRILPEAGGLISYGTSQADQLRRTGWYAAKIVKGEKPGDLPIEQLTKVELVVNLKTAQALGLTVPRIILARADEVIE